MRRHAAPALAAVALVALAFALSSPRDVRDTSTSALLTVPGSASTQQQQSSGDGALQQATSGIQQGTGDEQQQPQQTQSEGADQGADSAPDAVPAYETLSLRVSADGYNPLDQAASWYPWDYIAEPHKTTHLAVVDCSSDAVYSWAVTHHAAGYPTPVRTLSDSTGCEVKLVMTAVSTMHKVAIDLARGDGATSQHTIEVMCKYVRREIRDLTESDRERYFRAMAAVAKTDLETGIARYGTKFVNLEYFAVKHIHTQECSPFHGGLSFLTGSAPPPPPRPARREPPPPRPTVTHAPRSRAQRTPPSRCSSSRRCRLLIRASANRTGTTPRIRSCAWARPERGARARAKS